MVSSSRRFLFSETKVAAKFLASLSFSVTTRISPAFGTSLSPRISTGVEGPASFTFLPLSSIMARTLPELAPAAIKSPTRRVPFCTRMVATGPFPLSSSASITRPLALLFGFAFNSPTSAVRRIISRRLSMPSPVCADTGAKMVLPPQSSGISSYSDNSCFTLSIFALGLSILLMATMISTPAAFAWLIASTVCGITPSSAATTKMAMSVALAPRIRIAVNASCPGVSRKVIFCPSTFTMYAPMCWVIPPASRSVTCVFRIQSRREVFPWST